MKDQKGITVYRRKNKKGELAKNFSVNFTKNGKQYLKTSGKPSRAEAQEWVDEYIIKPMSMKRSNAIARVLADQPGSELRVSSSRCARIRAAAS